MIEIMNQLSIYTTSYQFIDIKKLIYIFDIKNLILKKMSSLLSEFNILND